MRPKTPIVDVPQVELPPLRDVFDRWRRASRAIALRPTSDARLDVMTKGVIAQDIFEIVVVRQGMRAWPDQRHVALQNIQQLRQFVDTGQWRHPPDGRDPRVG